MKRHLLMAALALLIAFAALYESVKAGSLSAPAAAPCAGPSCTPPEARLAATMAKYKRPTAIPFPDDDPFSPAKARLGQHLFFDPILSVSRTTSCATCHNPGLSWGDGRARSIGDSGATLPLRAPTILNVAWLDIMGWDGKFPSLEAVAFQPITSSAIMGISEDTAVRRIGSIPGYGTEFAEAFGDPSVTRLRMEQALATYERTLVSPPAPFDRWIAGDPSAISPAAKRGFDLFNDKANCAACHSGWAFSDGSFHDIGTASGTDVGRGARFHSSVKLRYAFKVPTLRDASRRMPYMHDGSVPTLRAVIDLYDRGGIDRPSRSVEIKPLNLTDGEKDDLIAFLDTLTSDPDPVTLTPFPR